MATADWRSAVKGEGKPKKEIKRMIHEKSHNGGHIVTHEHHHPEHHPDEKHTFSNLAEVHDHMQNHAGTPNVGEEAEANPAAQMTAAPSPAPEAAGAGAAPAIPGM